MNKKILPHTTNKHSHLLFNKTFYITSGLLALIILSVFSTILDNNFVNWDDNKYIYENPNIKLINAYFFNWLSKAIVVGNWHPLTVLSHSIDYQIWGLDPFGHHLTNLVIHAFNTVLVFLLVQLLLRAVHDRPKENTWTALLTALFFGLHPLRVESVAWASERKDILYAFFYLLSLITYLFYTYFSINKHKLYYFLSLTCFLLALLSKPMAVTLPVVLLILDFFPLKRLKSEIHILIVEKMPFYLLSFLFCAITMWSQNLDGAIKALEFSPLSIRIFVAVRAYIIYFEKFLFPFNLAPIYPYPLSTTNLASIAFIIPALILMLLLYIILRNFKKNRIFSALGLYYIITLLPVIGIIKVGDQALADRYSYLACLAPTLLCGLAVSNFLIFHGNRIYRKTTLIILILIVLFLSINTIKQLGVWQDSVTLWSHETKLYPDSISRAYLKLGLAYDDSGNSKMAIKSYSKAIDINPLYRDAFNNRAVAYSGEGNYLMAMQDLDKAIKLDPNDAISYSSRGNVYFRLGDMKKAITNYSKAISIAPQFVDAYNNRGFVNYTLNNMAQARLDFQKAIVLDSNYSEAYYTLALIDLKDGSTKKAVSNFIKAAQLGNREAQIYLQKNKTILSIK